MGQTGEIPPARIRRPILVIISEVKVREVGKTGVIEVWKRPGEILQFDGKPA